MRKITYNDINDKFFVDNGYWRIGLENAAAYRYVVIIPTEKWRKLFDTCMAKLNGKGIVTPELIAEVINENKTKRAYHKPENRYIKIKDRVNNDN